MLKFLQIDLTRLNLLTMQMLQIQKLLLKVSLLAQCQKYLRAPKISLRGKLVTMASQDEASYPKLEEGELRKNQPQKHIKVDGLEEKTYVEGTISNIDGRFGIFVRLNAKHTGLVHIKQLRQKKMTIQNFRKGDVVNVYISGIKKKKKQFHFYLDFCSIVRTNR